MKQDPPSAPPPGMQPGGWFGTTHWSVVLRAGRQHAPDSAAALETLCRTYWYPLYVYVRRQGHSPHDAQDLTQEFLARLLARQDLAKLGPEKGRFRSFLLAALKNFLLNEWKHARRLKRGGGLTPLPLDPGEAESRYTAEPSHDLTADKIFERRWALTLLDRSLNRVHELYRAKGRLRVFEELKDTLTGQRTHDGLAEIATRLRMTEAALKMAVVRLRQHYRQALRDEIASTVADPAEVEAELQHLVAILKE